MFDTTTFFSVWYWVCVAVFWSLASHFTHGVSYDVLSRAQRLGGEDARIFDLLARRSLARIDLGLRKAGVYGAALTGFVLAVVGVFAFVAHHEVAQGVFAMLAPAAWLMALSFREARSLHAAQPDLPTLLRRFVLRRRLNQSFGMFAVFVTVFAFAWKHQDRIFLFSHH